MSIRLLVTTRKTPDFQLKRFFLRIIKQKFCIGNLKCTITVSYTNVIKNNNNRPEILKKKNTVNSLPPAKFEKAFLLSAGFFFQNQLLFKILSGIPLECQTV